MSSNYLVYEEEHVDFTMLNVVNQFDQRSKRNFDGRKLDSTNMFRNMMMFRRERSYQCDQLSIPLSANVGVYEYLNYYDSIKLTEVCNYVDAIAEPLAQNQPSYDQSDVSMNLFNNEENYYETNHNQKNIELTNSNYEDYHEQLYDKYSDTNQNNNFISDINPPNDYQRFDDDNFSVDDQQQFNTQNVKGIDYFEIDDGSNNSDSSVEWLDSEEEINLKDNIEAFEGSDNEEHSAFATFEENLANGQDGDELYGTYNEETRVLEIEQSNLSLEVSSNSCHNLQIQINDSVDPDSSTTNSMQPMDDKSIAIRHKQELPSASPPQPNNDHLNDEHDSNLSNGDETEVDESWKEYESDRQSLVAIDNARNGTNTNCHEPSEDTSLNGSIPSTSDHQLHRSSPRITTDQEKNNPDSTIDYPKSKETTPKKRKQLLHSNEPKKKARKDNEEDDKEFSDDFDDDEDGVDGRRVRNEYRKMVKTIVFDCPECSQFFVSKHKLNEHLLGVHCKSPFICQAFGCKQPFDNSKLLKRHCKLHDKKTKWTCTEVNCKYRTLDRGCLYSHLFAYHEKGRFQCRLCSKEFQFRNEAKKHTDRAHKSNNTVQCNFGGCLYKSSCESRLKEHRLCHINLKPYECTWSGCGHASNRYRYVVKHVLTMHFQLPSTLREMKQSECDRDPKEFVRTKSFDFDAILKREQQKAQRNYNSKYKDGKGHSIASTSCVPENPSSNGSNTIPTKSVYKLRRSSVATKSRTDQEMNKCGLIGHRKNNENTGQKRKQPLDSNKTEKKVRKADEEEESNFSDEVEDSEDVVDHPKVKAVKVIGINCPECSILVENKHNLNEHLLNVHHQSPFICGAFGCKQRFDKSELLQKHYKLHDNKTKWICTATNCKYTTLCQRFLLVHFHSCHMKGRYQCGVCLKEYPFRKQAQCHFDYHHKRKTFKCSLGGCHFKSSFEIKLKEHQLSHLNLKPYECTWDGCGYAASRRRDVITHVRVAHFKLPHTLKEMKQRQIKCDRDPNEFVRSKSFDLNASVIRELQKAKRND